MGRCTRVGALATGVFAVAGETTAQEGPVRPNVVFIISDQHQANALGCYGAINRTITGESPTPNIDRLAQEGVLFTNAYTPSPLSAPSRASLQTGCYPYQHTAMRHKYDGQGSGERRYPGILDSLPTIGELFRESGYVTGAYGKMHVHGELKGVNDLGYDHIDLRFYTTYPGSHYADRANGDWNARYREMAPYKALTYRSIDSQRFSKVDKSLVVNKNNNNTHFIETLVEHEEQMFDYLVAEKSVQFIHTWATRKPFFLCVGFEKPHEPYTTHKHYMDMFPPEKMILPQSWNEILTRGPYPFIMNWLAQKTPDETMIRNTMAGYYACARSMDEQVGKLITACMEAGVYQNTIFVYTTDHGDHMYTHSLLQKHCMFDQAVRIPLIIAYPKEFNRGVQCNSLVSSLDIPATFVELAEIPHPKSFQGVSMRNAVTEPDSQRMVFSEFYEASHNYKMFPEATSIPMKMCRYGDFKYIYTHGFIEQLYDLKNDPREMHNLIIDQREQHSALIRKLRLATLTDWTIDDFPMLNVDVSVKDSITTFTVKEKPAQFGSLELYASPSGDMSRAELIATAKSGNFISCQIKKEKHRYFQIVCRPLLTRHFSPSKVYSQFAVATSRLASRLPVSVKMKVQVEDPFMSLSYTKKSIYK